MAGTTRGVPSYHLDQTYVDQAQAFIHALETADLGDFTSGRAGRDALRVALAIGS